MSAVEVTRGDRCPYECGDSCRSPLLTSTVKSDAVKVSSSICSTSSSCILPIQRQKYLG